MGAAFDRYEAVEPSMGRGTLRLPIHEAGKSPARQRGQASRDLALESAMNFSFGRAMRAQKAGAASSATRGGDLSRADTLPPHAASVRYRTRGIRTPRDAGASGHTPAMIVSCGVVLLDRRRAIFTGRASGTQRWDLPKGVCEPGEEPCDAAVREAWEESGLCVLPETLHDLGEFPYLAGKHLHLFAARVADGAFDPRDCRCRSYYPHHRTGRPTPEADAFAWQPLADMALWCGKGMTKVLSRLPWDRIDRLPELAAIAVDTESPLGP